MSVQSLTVPSRHRNDDGSGLVLIDVTTEHGDGTIRVEIDADGSTRAFLDGAAGLVPLGMWDMQGGA